MQELEGKAAVVIGGGSGVGRGIALGLAAEGMRVMVADIERDSAETVTKEIVERGGEATASSVDATCADSLASVVERSYDELGAVHVLSNNAGVSLTKPLADTTEADWQWVISLNLMSVVRSVAAFVPRMKAQGGESHIVNTASMAGLIAGTTRSVRVPIGVYTATKYACVGYTEALRNELAADGIGVSVLCPGMVKSNLGATSARNRATQFGGPFPEPGPLPSELEKMMMPGEAVGPIVVRGIRANRLHILTHPESRRLVEQRFENLLADFDFASDETR